MNKKEKLRRERISQSLKRYHKDKKIIARLDRELESFLELKTKKWRTLKLRTKVKSFPKKDEPAKFFYSTKRRYRLNKPIKVENNLGLRKVRAVTNKLKKKITSDIIKYNKKKKPINLGYRIKMTFTDKNGKNKKVIDSTSYRESFIPQTLKDIPEGIDLLKLQMLQAFKEYITTSGFSELTFFGLETEIAE